MIRMTKQTDYGIVLLSRMASRPERMFNAGELAAETRLPPPTVSKILKILGREGLLDSHRGVKGGYTLARAPHSITVTEIITALEGPIGITECIDDTPGECSHEARCPVRGNWHRINEAIRRALDEINLAEMAQPMTEPLVHLGGGMALENAELG
ncbi:MAG: SUF system Fe-S cluster assembly regulator [Gemmatimonadetes bacterium]|nr:SUF system Fe-S cluster assembly regulator [Gemmatimonadota bacterium]